MRGFVMSPLYLESMSTTKSVRRDQMRTSSLALALQVSAAAIKIIPVATAVFAFQFLGCPHQPPGEQNKVHGGALASQPTRTHVVKRERTCWAPDFFRKRILPSASLETLSTELLVYRNTSHTIVMVERSKRSFVYHLRSAILLQRAMHGRPHRRLRLVYIDTTRRCRSRGGSAIHSQNCLNYGNPANGTVN